MASVEQSDSLWVSGDDALRQWARWGHDRGPGWPSSCTIHRAIYGRGVTESQMPKDIADIDYAVAQLPALIKAVVRCYYVQRETPWRQHAKELHISRRDFEAKLRIGQTHVAQMI